MNFKRLNLLLGWIVGATASFVYLMTIEPTASFWDCGEFIACAHNQLVGHPPGAPLFLMLGRLFSMTNPAHAAMMVNVMSALASGFTILFMFWSLTYLVKKLVAPKTESEGLNTYQYIVIFGSALVGSLAYTFSDTFWFSAVEGEVYAMSSLFTAVVFWAMLRWESQAGQGYANRWLILIAYLMGLSIGVHLLNLLAIPAMVFIYYFKKYPVTTRGLLYAAGVSVVILAVTLYGIIPGVFKVGSWVELLFVNTMGLSINSGMLVYSFVLLGLLAFSVYYTHKRRKPLLNTIALCVTVLVLGYGSYAMILVRSAANTSMDQNNPENVFALIGYLNRDQYGDRPLVKGAYFNAPAIASEDAGPVYAALNGKYEVVDHKIKMIYDDRFITLFPRMFSSSPEHANFYKTWNGGYTGRNVRIVNQQGQNETVSVPTFRDNISFFFSYQLGYMYLRYFMWNFAGRQNDEQGHGEVTKGNWISGIPFIDNMRLGDQTFIPRQMKENRGRNAYFMLPLLLGLIGMVYQYRRGKRDFVVLALLFFFTGIAIVIYLNQSPIQPRERDYAYAGSFYAFAFWIGIGVAGLAEVLRKYMKPAIAGGLVTVVSLLAVPGIMAKENRDDHDRSGRTLARDFAYNYLNSCKENSVLFTYGDNDTFPLWYIQEVEGVRRDIRIMNLSYASADWYLKQMKEQYYESAPLPMSLTYEKVVGSRRAITEVQNRLPESDLKQAMDFVMSDDPATKTRSRYMGQEFTNYFPSRTLTLKVDAGNALAAGIISEKDNVNLASSVDITLKQSSIYRNNLAILDLVANADWKRPIYWGVTVPSSYNMGFEQYMRGAGLANLLVPMRAQPNDSQGTWTNTEEGYDKVMNQFEFRGLNNPKIYYDETCVRMIISYRNMFSKLAYALINEGKDDKAREVLNKYLEVFPTPRMDFYSSATLYMVDALHRVGEHEKANEVSRSIVTDAADWLRYIKSVPKYRRHLEQDKRFVMQNIGLLQQTAQQNQQDEHMKEIEDIVGALI